MDFSELRTFSQAVLDARDAGIEKISEPSLRALAASGALGDALLDLGGRKFLIRSRLIPLLLKRQRKSLHPARGGEAA